MTVTSRRTAVATVAARRSSSGSVAPAEVDKTTRYPGAENYPSLVLYPSAGQ